MEIGLIAIVISLIIHSAFKDYLFSKEREKLEMKLMSKNLNEYVSSIAPEAEATKQIEDPFISIEDATIEQILKTKDKV